MKNKVKYFIFIFLMLILIKIPGVFAKGKVEIESIDLIDKSQDATEVSTPTIDNLSIGLDLKFATLNDYIKYKIVVNNSTDEDYELSDKNLNASEYITYEYSFEDDVKIVKKNSKLVVYIIAKYTKELPTDKFENGEFKEDNSIVISLSNDGTTTNPNTGDKFNIYLIVLILSSIAILGLILTKKTHDKKYLSLLIISLMLIPTSIYALKKVEITISAKTTIEQKYSIYYRFSNYGTGLYFKESDKDKYIYSEEYCDETPSMFVVQDDGSKEPYINCSYFLYKNEKNYSSNELVSLDELKINEIKTYGDNGYLCVYDYETETQTCPKEAVKQVTYKTFAYESGINETFNINDYNRMDFSNKETVYKDDYSIIFDLPNTFKMLNHDIILLPQELSAVEMLNPSPIPGGGTETH